MLDSFPFIGWRASMHEAGFQPHPSSMLCSKDSAQSCCQVLINLHSSPERHAEVHGLGKGGIDV